MARTTRRDLLRIGVVLGAAALVMARPWQRLADPGLAFEEMPRLAPLRRLVADGAPGGGSATQAVFAGLDGGGEVSAAERSARRRIEEDLCAELRLPWRSEGALPVTYFTDIRCPSCRVLEGTLASLRRDESISIDIATREFPVFGPRSEAAARAVVAADAQGAADAARAHLRTRPAPMDIEGAAALARALELDPARYAADWAGSGVATRLAGDRALARLLGLPGTPGLVVGRTVVVGTRSRDTLHRLIEAERKEGPPASCG
ncbi:DsbA family protein [Roseibacterium sp. SDUM158017]|uniref:DsbA family protein n=1 Tax=Roseicyclus salinarum TaxID=3036773 RepID=UPI0024158ADF|nr:DsbA family protein [Roseibacterium sp. SDUM158017]MDG4648861.1 DsbA family protein [Roseibacterium sp. SDUM158017]